MVTWQVQNTPPFISAVLPSQDEGLRDPHPSPHSSVVPCHLPLWVQAHGHILGICWYYELKWIP